ncbi:Transforming growth factor-beta-induced protein ig-h3 [Folsomia candida]|uniref:Transforming growth factor-beta-induced protein ig-h3 n=1 Tax=Folsomia candida TaxID=158441 RepID=A0A226E1F6_FOLCA|nr:Transforming growth factor-beta-induced protein ig-h3 [Folsomia candida]
MRSLVMLPSLCLLLCLVTFQIDAKPKIPWWQLKVTRAQGPNACIVEEIPDLGKKYYTECKYWPERKVCGRDTVIRYECCEGYKQRQGEEGCTGVKPLKNVLETARDLGATRFVNYLEESGLGRELAQEGTFTLFAPVDAGFEGYYGNSVATKIQSFRNSGYNPVLNYHVSERKLPSKDFSGNTELNSMHENRTLRISKYSTGMEAVNCVLISRKDQEASNGIVHMIDSPLDPTLWMQQDVVQVIAQDGRFAKMSQAIQRCGFASRLREIGKTFTVLAPSDEAFLKIPPARFEKMVNDRASCIALLENHVVPHVMCTPVITEEYKARSISPSGRLTFDCDEKGHSVEGKKLSGEFILGQNGIVYMVDDVLIPDRARTLLELAESRGMTTFVHLVRVAGLEDTFNTFGDYTLFAPSESAFLEMDGELLEEARRNSDLARSIILYHATQSRILSNTIKNNQNVMSLDEENPLRLIVYRKSYGVEDAVMEKTDLECMNGVMHIVNKVLFPATQSAGDILRKSANYSMFLEAMEKVMMSEPSAIDLRKTQENSHYTFFVNDANVLKRDITSSNGIIHVIDKIMLPENDY